jgi:hypothetical protein
MHINRTHWKNMCGQQKELGASSLGFGRAAWRKKMIRTASLWCICTEDHPRSRFMCKTWSKLACESAAGSC